MNNKKISIVVPVFNEVNLIDNFITEVNNLEINYELIFSCDPSNDGTEEKLKEYSDNSGGNIKTIVMSRRFGQHPCIFAGISEAKGDAVVVMDIDGQDPVSVLPDMIQKWSDGFEVVYGKRVSRLGETFLKKIVARLGLRLISKFSKIDIPTDVGEFRLMDRKVVDIVNSIHEANPFLRGIVSYIGFKQVSIEFERQKRKEGESKYNIFNGSISFGLKGFTSFSNSLLYTSILLGILSAFVAFILGMIYAYFKIKGIINFPIGNPTIVILILFIGGIQLFSIGILGMYIGQIFDQVKNRPLYIIEKTFE